MTRRSPASRRASRGRRRGQRARGGRREDPRPRYRRCVRAGGAGGANSQVSATPDLPSVPSEVPSSVKVVAPEEAVRTSIVSRAVNLSDRPLPRTVPAAPVAGSILPSTQTLIRAPPLLPVTTRSTPLWGTVTFRVRLVALPSVPAAETVIAHRPGASCRGVAYAPSAATVTCVVAGVAGGAGVATLPPTTDPDGPRYEAATDTDEAFVALPPTRIAPFSKEAPSEGWSTVSVGASIWRNGTVRNSLTVPSERLPVSGSSALTSNWFRPRRRSTSYAHVPSEVAVTWNGCSWPGDRIETVAPGSVVPLSV